MSSESKPAGCNCIAETNAMLAEYNTVLVTTMFRKPDAVAVATDRISTARGAKKAAIFIASFCPFCGERYPERAA